MFKYRLPQANSKHYLILLTLMLALSSLACPPTCPPDCPPRRDRVVLIFSDVTSSLLEEESKQVSALTCEIVDSLPPGTQYAVYPIQNEGQKIEPLYEGRIIVRNSATTEDASEERKNTISAKIKELYDLIKTSKRSDAYGKPDNHTCILNTLNKAQTVFKQFDEKNTDFDLIYVSDMIEECNVTPMGKPISLEHANISEAIKLAKDTNLNVDLSHARISMIIPVAAKVTYIANGRPNTTDVQAFWEAILLHCGFDEGLLKDPQKFYFSSEIPRYLKS